MKKQPSPRLLQWADDEKGHSVSAGVLSLNDVVAAATVQESAKDGTLSPPTLDEVPELAPARSLPASLSLVKKS